jgi:hypothetical protein
LSWIRICWCSWSRPRQHCCFDLQRNWFWSSHYCCRPACGTCISVPMRDSAALLSFVVVDRRTVPAL